MHTVARLTVIVQVLTFVGVMQKSYIYVFIDEKVSNSLMSVVALLTCLEEQMPSWLAFAWLAASKSASLSATYPFEPLPPF